ncbi:MAG: hypothetical protein GVY36_02280 [Verrucomicrobia bacterium]|jgi:predicted nuclease of predicted toxin-antitoxin system|nr:hypothetical protein [Verrucomicrobiota bacterium]
MNFLIDVQLPGTLVRWLNERGHDALHALDLGLGQADDRKIWEIAAREKQIVISKDEDFFILATRPEDMGSLLWLRFGNCRTRDLLATLNKNWDAIESAFFEGQRIVEVR